MKFFPISVNNARKACVLTREHTILTSKGIRSMKTISTLTLIAAIAAFITPQQAKAGDKEKAIIGGLIGGIIIGSVLADDDHHHTTVSYSHRSSHRDQCNTGHWEWRSEKRWVPGYYRYSRDRCGYKVRTWVSGYYEYNKRKVWVSDRRYDRSDRHHGRHHSSYEERRDRYDRYDRRDDRRDRRDDRRDHRRYQDSGQVVRNF